VKCRIARTEWAVFVVIVAGWLAGWLALGGLLYSSLLLSSCLEGVDGIESSEALFVAYSEVSERTCACLADLARK
jgi:hypothetical protein